MRGINELLLEHAFFKGMPQELSRIIAGCGRQTRFEQGAYLFRQDEPADTFYLLRRGQVGLEWHNHTGTLLFQTEHPGDVINTSWIVPPYLCASDARALDTSIAVALDAKCL
ncbi:MAG: cyclic nucleotide-binding domain-containing protein, partial [Alphaproteobacteria bacterium]|nr:cyclic nucleotide-binding domain-containing protein [Alphaproteobacteria bacterium]